MNSWRGRGWHLQETTSQLQAFLSLPPNYWCTAPSSCHHQASENEKERKEELENGHNGLNDIAQTGFRSKHVNVTMVMWFESQQYGPCKLRRHSIQNSMAAIWLPTQLFPQNDWLGGKILGSTTLDNKKRTTITEIRGEKNAVRSWDIMLNDARSTQGKVIRDCPRLLPCADSASSSMISHNGTAFFSPRISGMVLFFVQGSKTYAHWPHRSSLRE